MSYRNTSVLRILFWAAVGLGLLGFLFTRFHPANRFGQDVSRVWFYDLDSRKLYPMDSEAIPPDKRNGGEGVKALVVEFKAGGPAEATRKIAYLETCTPALKELLEQVKAAHAGGRVYPGPIPARGSRYFQTNTLVRRLDETQWHDENSVEGRAILVEWQSWHGANGERPLVSLPQN